MPAFILTRHSLICGLLATLTEGLGGEAAYAKDVEPLAIGAAAPELNLPGVDGKTYRIDPREQKEAALKVLKKHCVSCTNYIFAADDRDKLADLVDPEWEGPVPYTILIAPGGKIVKRWKDEIDPADLKSEISNVLGKTYASRK